MGGIVLYTCTNTLSSTLSQTCYTHTKQRFHTVLFGVFFSRSASQTLGNIHLLQDVPSPWQRHRDKAACRRPHCTWFGEERQTPRNYCPSPHVQISNLLCLNSRNAEWPCFLLISFAPVSSQHFCTLGLRGPEDETNTDSSHRKVFWLKWLAQQHAQNRDKSSWTGIKENSSHSPALTTGCSLPAILFCCSLLRVPSGFYKGTGNPTNTHKYILISIYWYKKDPERDSSAVIKYYILMNMQEEVVLRGYTDDHHSGFS